MGADTKALLLKNLNSISHDIFGQDISQLSIDHMRSSWQILAQDELLMMAIHQEQKTFTELKGTCGSVYALEKTIPYSTFFPEVIPSMTWFKRVKIAKSFLYLLKEFQNTEIGLLSHCDIQEGNFGLTKNLEVKAIDVDLIYSPNRMKEILTQPRCTSDDECDFFDCVSKCDVAAGQCTHDLITNNLQVSNVLRSLP